MSSAIPVGMVATGHAASLYWDGTSTGPDADGGAGTWSSTQGLNWSTAATGGANDGWLNGSDAVFGGTGALVTVTGEVSAASLAFTSQNYRLSGGTVRLTGTPAITMGANDVTLQSVITGSAAITKTGTGTLTLSGTNVFTGVMTISEGKVKAASAAAFGNSSTGTTISSGATLDINGQELGNERFTISGTGVGGAGAIVNTGGTSLNAIRSMTLADNATIGGPGHWYIYSGGSVAFGGNTLTKIGTNDFGFGAAVSSSGHIEIKEGAFWFMPGTNLGGNETNTVKVSTGAMLAMAAGQYPNYWSVAMASGSTWRAALGSSPSWSGPVGLAGATTFDVQVDTTMIHQGKIFGNGSATKTGPGTWTLRDFNGYSGGTTVNAGNLVLDSPTGSSDGAGSLRGVVTVNQGGTLTLNQPDVVGTATGLRITALNIAGGLVDNTVSGSNSVPVINLTGGTLRSNNGTASLTTTSRYTLRDGATVNSLAAAVPSVISGRLHLSTGNAGDSSVFTVAGGTAVENLRIEAAITGAGAANGITKRGGGLLALYGPAAFTGATVVEEGSLLVDGPKGTLEDSVVSVASGADFGTTVPGKTFAGITAEGGSSLMLPALTGGTTVVEGALNFSGGTVKIRPLIGEDTPVGTYDLVVAGSITGGGTPVLDLGGAVSATRATGSVVVSGNKLQLILTGTGSALTWNNASASGAASGSWDSTLANFSNGVGSESFRAFDSVTFNDSVAPGSAKTIALGEVLAPARVTVDNSNGDYTFNGAGRLIGVGSLVKSGTGKLTVAGPDSYGMNGAITAGGGTIDFTGKPVLTSALTLKSGAVINNATITTGPMTLESGSANVRLLGNAPWTKTTAGTVTLTGSSSLTGPGTVTAGHLVVGNLTTPELSGWLGTGPVAISNGAAVTFSRTFVESFYLGTDMFHRFSGSGSLNLKGAVNLTASRFNLRGISDTFTGPVSATNAIVSVTAPWQLGSGPLSLTGTGGLIVDGTTQSYSLPNAITMAPLGTSAGNLSLMKATLTGPITLTAGSASATIGIEASSQIGRSIVSGPIGEVGGSAGLLLLPSTGGTITLSGASTYTGSTLISSGGVVELTGSLGGTAVSVGGMSILAGNGVIGSGGSLTFANRGVLKVGTSGGALTVNGNVTLGAITNIAVDVKGGAAPSGPIPVLNYTGTLTGTAANLVMDVPANYRKAEFALTPGLITVDLGSKTLIWKGTNPYWNSTTTMNWGTTDAGAATDYFFKGDSVVFNDSGPGGNVNGFISQYVQPASVLVDSSKDYGLGVSIQGACSVIKRGTGTLALGGSNTHTGGTTVEAGGLQVSGFSPVGSGPFSVAAGATLTGHNATIGGTTPSNIAGALDPALPGESWSHNLTFGSLVLSGSYLCQLGQSDSDLIEVNGSLNLTGSTLVLNKTATFNVPASYTIATYTGTLTGGFATVTGMPSGYGLKYDTAAKKILVVRVNYADWIAGSPGLSDTTDGGDPDGDGIPNLVEYVVGGNPGANDSAVLPTQEFEGDKLVFRYKRNDASVSTTTQTVQWSPDMTSWTDIVIPENSFPGVFITKNGDQPDDVKVSITRVPGKMYVRLKVEQK